MRHVIPWTSNTAVSTATRYYAPTSSGGGGSATEGEFFAVIPAACTMRKLRVYANAAPDVGNSYTITVRKRTGGTGSWADTSLAMTLSGTDIRADSGSTDATFAAGDWICLKITPSSAFTACILTIWMECEPSDADTQVILGCSQSDVARTSTNYSTLTGTEAPSATEGNTTQLIPIGGKFTALYVGLEAAAGSGKSRLVALRDDGSTSGTLTVTISGTTATSGNATGDHTIGSDSLCGLIHTPSSTPATSTVGWGLVWSPDAENSVKRRALLLNHAQTLSNASERFFQPMGSPVIGGTEANYQSPIPVGGARLKTFKAQPVTTLTGSGTYTITLRRDGAARGHPSNASILLNSTSGGGIVSDTSNDVDVFSPSRIVVGVVPASSPTASRLRWSCVYEVLDINLSSGASHYFKFDNSLDDAFGSVDLSTDGSPTFNNSVYKLGTHALDCSGSSQRARLGDADFASLTSFTVCGWFNAREAADGNSASGDQPLWGKGTSADEAWSLIRIGHSDIRFYISNSSDVSTLASSIAAGGQIICGRWIFLVATYDAGVTRLYFFSPSASTDPDARTGYGSGAPSPLNDSAEPFYINWSANDYAAGYGDNIIDGVGVWNRVLNAAEIGKLYSEGSGDESWIPVVYSESITEGAKAGDAVASAATYPATITEGALAGDSLVSIKPLSGTITEGAVAGDSYAATLTAVGAVTDGAVAGDTTASVATYPTSITDGAVAGDTNAATLTAAGAVTEGALAGDATDGTVTTSGTTYSESITEGVKLGDSYDAALRVDRSITEGVKAGETRPAEFVTKTNNYPGDTITGFAVEVGDLVIVQASGGSGGYGGGYPAPSAASMVVSDNLGNVYKPYYFEHLNVPYSNGRGLYLYIFISKITVAGTATISRTTPTNFNDGNIAAHRYRGLRPEVMQSAVNYNGDNDNDSDIDTSFASLDVDGAVFGVFANEWAFSYTGTKSGYAERDYDAGHVHAFIDKLGTGGWIAKGSSESPGVTVTLGSDATNGFASFVLPVEQLWSGLDTDGAKTEGALLGDSVSATVTTVRTITEGALAGDTYAATVTSPGFYQEDVAEGAKAGDSYEARLVAQGAITEGALAGDAEASALRTAGSVTEGTLLGDTVVGDIATGTYSRDLTEGALLGDSVSATIRTFGTVTEGALIGDTQSGSLTTTGSVTEGVLAGDSQSGSLTTAGSITEGSLVGDTVVGEIASGINGSVAEGVELGDSCEGFVIFAPPAASTTKFASQNPVVVNSVLIAGVQSDFSLVKSDPVVVNNVTVSDYSDFKLSSYSDVTTLNPSRISFKLASANPTVINNVTVTAQVDFGFTKADPTVVNNVTLTAINDFSLASFNPWYYLKPTFSEYSYDSVNPTVVNNVNVIPTFRDFSLTKNDPAVVNNVAVTASCDFGFSKADPNVVYGSLAIVPDPSSFAVHGIYFTFKLWFAPHYFRRYAAAGVR